MKNNKTDITIVLDRSGSMDVVAKDTVGGFNRFIEDQKKMPGEAVLTLVQFDTEYEFVHKGKSISEIPSLDFHPRGATALLDAMGRAIFDTGERLKNTPEHERPGKVVFVIITDGEENSSREYKKAQISESIKRQTDIYKWEFVFLGANQDAIREGTSFGIGAANAMTYDHNSKGMAAAFACTSNNLRSFRSGSTQTMAYSQQDRDEAVSDKSEKPK